jgi:GNAT superfamily N-acetyltransferase
MVAEPILTHPTEPQLAQAVEENLFALFRAMAGLPGSALVEGDLLSYHLAPPSNPMFKGVWSNRLYPGEADRAIEDTIEWFKGRGAPFFFWWTGSATTPGDLGERLTAHGLLSMEAQMEGLAPGIKSTALGAPCMVADLNHMNEAALTQIPAGFNIEVVGDEPSLQQFKQVLVEGYEIPGPIADGWVQAALSFGLNATPWKMYLGRLNGEPVATNMLFCGGGVASIYGVAVIPSARGKGIGAAISLKPLLEARQQGYHHGVLFSTDMGLRTYERIGFRDTGARINRYLWRNG